MRSGALSILILFKKMKNKIKLLVFFLFIVFSISLVNVSLVNAQLDSTTAGQKVLKQAESFNEGAGFQDANTGAMSALVATVIKAFISLLGIIFVILIIYAGYSWMTAAGDEAKVTKAKDTLQRAVIGLIIIVAAYSITFFVFQSLDSVSGPGGPTSGPTP